MPSSSHSSAPLSVSDCHTTHKSRTYHGRSKPNINGNELHVLAFSGRSLENVFDLTADFFHFSILVSLILLPVQLHFLHLARIADLLRRDFYHHQRFCRLHGTATRALSDGFGKDDIILGEPVRQSPFDHSLGQHALPRAATRADVAATPAPLSPIPKRHGSGPVGSISPLV